MGGGASSPDLMPSGLDQLYPLPVDMVSSRVRYMPVVRGGAIFLECRGEALPRGVGSACPLQYLEGEGPAISRSVKGSTISVQHGSNDPLC